MIEIELLRGVALGSLDCEHLRYSKTKLQTRIGEERTNQCPDQASSSFSDSMATTQRKKKMISLSSAFQNSGKVQEAPE